MNVLILLSDAFSPINFPPCPSRTTFSKPSRSDCRIMFLNTWVDMTIVKINWYNYYHLNPYCQTLLFDEYWLRIITFWRTRMRISFLLHLLWWQHFELLRFPFWIPFSWHFFASSNENIKIQFTRSIYIKLRRFSILYDYKKSV